jgi:hypothetical protein
LFVATTPPAEAKGNLMKSAKKNAGYGAKDLRTASDRPTLTKVDYAKARP